MSQARARTPAILALILFLLPAPTALAAPETALVWDLVTVGPDTDLFSLWGHSALCVSSGEFEQGSCFDFGVPREDDPVRRSLGTLAGARLFGVVKLPTRVELAVHQFRDTVRQRLDIPPERGRALLADLEALVLTHASYAYQPLFRNCTTELRDRLDQALAGRLRAGADQPDGVPLRTLAEAGLTGRVVPLSLLALAGGTVLDQPSTSWQRMALPDGLMQAATQRLSAPPVRLFSRTDVPPPTSPAAGRIVLVLVSALVCFCGWLLVRRRPARARLVGLGLGVGLTLASLPPWAGTLSTLPCLHDNWMLFALVPTDGVLCLTPGHWLKRYAWLRLLSLGVLGAAALLGLVVQSLWIGLWLAGLPLGLWLWIQRRPAR